MFHSLISGYSSKSVDPVQYHARVERCVSPPNPQYHGFYLSEADGTLTNITGSRHSYTLKLVFLDAQGGVIQRMDRAVDGLAGGKTVHWTAPVPVGTPTPAARCNIEALVQYGH